MADADRGLRDGMLLELRNEVGELAGFLAVLNTAAVDDGDARGIISAVLQALQSFHEHVESRMLVQMTGQADIANNSTHGLYVISDLWANSHWEGEGDGTSLQLSCASSVSRAVMRALRHLPLPSTSAAGESELLPWARDASKIRSSGWNAFDEGTSHYVLSDTSTRRNRDIITDHQALKDYGTSSNQTAGADCDFTRDRGGRIN
jgi:hypothetical protein